MATPFCVLIKAAEGQPAKRPPPIPAEFRSQYWLGQRCGNCYWADNIFPYEGQTAEDVLLECQWPAEQLPYSLRYGNRERLSVAVSDGAKCPQYEWRLPGQEKLYD